MLKKKREAPWILCYYNSLYKATSFKKVKLITFKSARLVAFLEIGTKKKKAKITPKMLDHCNEAHGGQNFFHLQASLGIMLATPAVLSNAFSLITIYQAPKERKKLGKYLQLS